jgi:sugar phosphate isomerase/epimerase
MTRRDFGRLSALGLSALAKGIAMAQPWKLGVITDEVSFELSPVLDKFCPKYGLKYVEIRYATLGGKKMYVATEAGPAEVKELRKRVDDAGVKITVLDSPVYKIQLPGTTIAGEDSNDLHPVKGQYAQQLDQLKHSASVAHGLGVERVRIFSFRRVSDPNTVFNRVVDELNKAIDVAKSEGIGLVLENEFDCNVGTGSESGRLFRAIPDRTLMHNWDPGNCVEAGEQPFPKAWDQLDHSRINHMHLKDAKNNKWMPIGSGEIDFIGQFRALKQMGYTGTLSLETHYKNAQHDLYTSSVESMDGLMKVLKQV